MTTEKQAPKELEYYHAAAKAAEQAKELGLPELKGSKEQIQYAEQIRLRWIVQELIQSVKMQDSLGDLYARGLFYYLQEQTKCSFWIEANQKHRTLGNFFSFMMGDLVFLTEVQNYGSINID
ncbi:hypothetical protein CA830_25935 [Burkholderia multivorans]|nr:hypothetical protein [Burkholderia multivorans]OXH86483.1 hypothetical protein CA830_25935 [Burkholderia multivorans]OXH90919.1 hypothetical protein CA831_08660 [Burkholderia multivorans]